MRTASAATIAILNGTAQILRADLYTITLLNGTVLRWTNADIALTVSGNTYLSGPILKRSSTKQSIGIAVDQLVLTIGDDGSTLISGLGLIVQVVNGLFDGATIALEKLFLTSWTDTSPGSVPWFIGKVSDVSAELGQVRLTVKSVTELLNQQMPRMINQPTCNNTLYDSNCGLVIGTWTTATTVSTTGFTPTKTKFKHTSTVQADTYFALGKVRFTGGQNSGQVRSIKSYVGGVIEVFNPLPFAPALGDGISITPGCDKTQAMCTTKFSNLARNASMPYIPDPATAVGSNASPGGVSAAGGTGGSSAGSATTAAYGPGTYSA